MLTAHVTMFLMILSLRGIVIIKEWLYLLAEWTAKAPEPDLVWFTAVFYLYTLYALRETSEDFLGVVGTYNRWKRNRALKARQPA